MKKLFLASLIGLTLSACGGGSDSSTNSPSNNPSTGNGGTLPSVDTPSFVVGSISRVCEDGTISVNGDDYRVDTIQYQNQNLNDTLLKEGVHVEMTANKDKSANVELDPTIVGEVTARDGSRFSVNGVNLSFEALPSDINIGDSVFVYTNSTSDGGYDVTAVTKVDTQQFPSLADIMEIQGRISAINENTQTLTLGADVNVFYGDAIKLPLGGLRVGQWVEIDGYYNADFFVALEIELEDYDFGDQSGVAEVEGIVTSVINLASNTPTFTLNFRTEYSTNSSTCYRLEDSYSCDPELINNLKFGAEVEVKSTFIQGKHVAIDVEFERTASNGGTGTPPSSNGWIEFECEGFASNYNANTRTFTMPYCEQEIGDIDMPLADRTVHIDAFTRFEKILEQNLNGARVEVEGVIINGKNVAREIELEY